MDLIMTMVVERHESFPLAAPFAGTWFDEGVIQQKSLRGWQA